MSLKEKGQCVLAFGVIAVMLFIVGFPVVILAFFGVLAFFVWKVFTSETRTETRRVFEFYLLANEILRDDERRWYGFEVREVIARGEAVLKSMPSPPPLVYFSLGALSRKIGDHAAAVRYLSHVVDGEGDESSIVFPTRDLREYVRMLRKIERAPAEAPLTSAAVRSLERARRNRAEEFLRDSRDRIAQGAAPRLESVTSAGVLEAMDAVSPRPPSVLDTLRSADAQDAPEPEETPDSPTRHAPLTTQNEKQGERKTISEVLHDIYDRNVH